jgi:hypothetical protein
MRLRVVALVSATFLVVGLVTAPGTVAKAKPCKRGTVKAKVGGRATCLPKRLVLPKPAKTAPGLAQLRGALDLTELGFKTRSGKRVAPMSKRVGRSWKTARARVLKATAFAFARISNPGATAAAASPCEVIDIITAGGSFGADADAAVGGGSFNVGGASVSMGITSNGMQLGIRTTVNGDTYSFKYDSGLSDCAKNSLPACPEADGTLNGFGTKGKTGFSTTVTRDGRVLSKRSYAKSVTYDTKGHVGDDAKLDTVDVRYSEITNGQSDGVRYSSYGTRSTQINMRTGSYGPGESSSFGNASGAGESVNTAGMEADAQDFAAFVNKTIGEYRQRENAWQKANTCAKLTFDPAKDSKKVKKGETGTFSAKVTAVNGGGTATKARYAIGSQQNGSFTPTTSTEPSPTFNYTVTSQPSGRTLSAGVHVTSTAGVAEDTWSQKIEDQLKTISGNFTGHAEDSGVIYDWTGTATFEHVDTAPEAAPGGIFQLVSGQATVTVSGSLDGSGCSQTGTTTIGLFDQSPWTVRPSDPTYTYSMVVAFQPDRPKATNTNCSDPNNNGSDAGLGSMPVAALQSGSNASNLSQTTTDLLAYSGSATSSDEPPANWTWSFTGELEP